VLPTSRKFLFKHYSTNESVVSFILYCFMTNRPKGEHMLRDVMRVTSGWCPMMLLRLRLVIVWKRRQVRVVHIQVVVAEVITCVEAYAVIVIAVDVLSFFLGQCCLIFDEMEVGCKSFNIGTLSRIFQHGVQSFLGILDMGLVEAPNSIPNLLFIKNLPIKFPTIPFSLGHNQLDKSIVECLLVSALALVSAQLVIFLHIIPQNGIQRRIIRPVKFGTDYFTWWWAWKGLTRVDADESQ